jgi:branched-chain amino acid transport system substrate-binding protein
MSRVSSLVLAGLLASAGLACRKSEEPAAPAPGEGEQKAAEAPAAAAPSKEIVLGQIMPYSGPASAYGTIGKLQAAYFAKVNKNGGVNGRTIKLISLDDSYSPPKAVEQVRKLVEQEHVVAVFNAVGTPSNSAIQKYLNDKHVAQLFVSSGATKWADPTHFPYTIGFNPSYHLEGKTYAQDLLSKNPKAKVAVLYQNDDFGKDVLAGFKEGMGDKAKQIIAEASYEATDPTIDSQMVTLKGSKADAFVNIATPKFAAQAIRKAADLKWKATQYLANVSASVGSVLTPAGLDKSKGITTIIYLKDTTDKRWDGDPAVQAFRDFMKNEYPEGKITDGINIYAYATAETLVEVIKKCGDDLSAENLIKQAASLKDFAPGLFLPDVKLNTSPTDFEPFDQLQLAQFDGTTWVPNVPTK